MHNILITGGTGLIGKHLIKELSDKGYPISILSRKRISDSKYPTYIWNVDKMEIDNKAIEWADVIIHLAGTNIGEMRWTKKRKKEIADSRIKSSELIFNAVKKQNNKLKAFISASAIGFYGTINSNKIFTENDSPANDFLGEVCNHWEQTVEKFKELEIRTVKIRTGVVLSKQEGALSKMIIPVKAGLGAALGSGKQFVPWIHIDDLCNIYIKAIEDSQMAGAYNAVASNETNKTFTKTLAHILGKPFWLPNIPEFFLKILFGEMADILLKGSQISNHKIKKSRFTFAFPDLEKTLINLFQS
jgi:uncharacterized protein